MPPREMQPAGGSELSMHIRGPSKAVISSKPILNGYTVDYFPSEPGEYNLTVLCDNDHVPSSPFTVQVRVDVLWYVHICAKEFVDRKDNAWKTVTPLPY
jgi:hypothetical protein